MFKVQEVTFGTNTGDIIDTHQILKNNMPVFKINCFLEAKGRSSVHTAKQYAYRICKFLNYLNDIRNKDYKNVTKQDIVKFIDSIIFESDGTLYIQKGKVTYNTAGLYLTAIKELYRYLEDELFTSSNIVWDKIKGNPNGQYLYGQIWSFDTKTFLDGRVDRTKSSKEYIKWYTEEERECILANFRTLRDKAIFLLSLDGLRIDEILSLRNSDFNSSEGTISPYRSKGKETGNVGSIVVISNGTIKTLSDYIFTERDEALIKLQEKNKDFEYPNILFLNLRDDENLGKPLKYRNYTDILKLAAKKAGLDPKKIRTHSGRSTKTMDLIHYQAEHPEMNLSDEHIRQLMRWKNPNSIVPYINSKDKKLALLTAKKINESKNKESKNEK